MNHFQVNYPVLLDLSLYFASFVRFHIINHLVLLCITCDWQP